MVGDILVTTHEMDCTSENGADFTIPVGATFEIEKIEQGIAHLKPEYKADLYDTLQVPVFNIKRGFRKIQTSPTFAFSKDVESQTYQRDIPKDSDPLIVQVAYAVGKVIGQFQFVEPYVLHKTTEDGNIKGFEIRCIPDSAFRELMFACVNHLSHLLPELPKESIPEE